MKASILLKTLCERPVMLKTSMWQHKFSHDQAYMWFKPPDFGPIRLPLAPSPEKSRFQNLAFTPFQDVAVSDVRENSSNQSESNPVSTSRYDSRPFRVAFGLKLNDSSELFEKYRKRIRLSFSDLTQTRVDGAFQRLEFPFQFAPT
jgi:hypothetical protein